MFLCYFSHLSFFKLYKTQQTPSTTKKSATNVGKKTKRQIKSVDIGPREATFSRPDKQTEICNWDLERIHLTGMTKKSIQKCIEFKTALKKVNVNWKLLLIDYNNINHTMWSKRQWTFCIQFAHFFFFSSSWIEIEYYLIWVCWWRIFFTRWRHVGCSRFFFFFFFFTCSTFVGSLEFYLIQTVVVCSWILFCLLMMVDCM